MAGSINYEGQVGSQPIGDMYVNIVPGAGVPGWQQDGQLEQLGQRAMAGYQSGLIGGGEFIYVQSTGGIAGKKLCLLDGTWNATLNPTTASKGAPVYVTVSAIPAGGFGWVQATGLAIITTDASVAAGLAVSYSAANAGNVTTLANSTMLTGAIVTQPSTATQSFPAANTITGSNFVAGIDNSNAFIGMAITGTGIPASTTVTARDPSGFGFTISNAATATGSATLTGTMTGFLQLRIEGPACQSQIT